LEELLLKLFSIPYERIFKRLSHWNGNSLEPPKILGKPWRRFSKISPGKELAKVFQKFVGRKAFITRGSNKWGKIFWRWENPPHNLRVKNGGYPLKFEPP